MSRRRSSSSRGKRSRQASRAVRPARAGATPPEATRAAVPAEPKGQPTEHFAFAAGGDRPPRTATFPPVEAVLPLLARIDQAGLPADEHAVLRRLIEQYVEAVTLIGKPGVTMAELRARLARRK